jgi:glyoxylate carboligase
MAISASLNVQTASKAEKRISSYLMAEYLERLGVEVIFGLCGHTVIAMLDALGKSRIRFITTRHEQIAAHMADGYTRASGKTGVVLTVRNRHSRAEEMNLGLSTIRANCSQTAVSGTASTAVWADLSADDERGIRGGLYRRLKRPESC